jgi:hypothetical protein
MQFATAPKDPVPREFLGAERPELAWSVLERDSLTWALDSESRALTGHEWVVARSTAGATGSAEETTGSIEGATGPTESATGSTILVWNADTEVAGKLRPAGTRQIARRRAELPATIALLGADRDHFGVQRFESEVRDLSGGGMGLWIADPLKKFDARDLQDHRVRVELTGSGQGSNIALADVCWVKPEDNDRGMHGWKMGLKFIEPTAEFNDTVEELLRPGKGDIQLLWNLWQANTR